MLFTPVDCADLDTLDMKGPKLSAIPLFSIAEIAYLSNNCGLIYFGIQSTFWFNQMLGKLNNVKCVVSDALSIKRYF